MNRRLKRYPTLNAGGAISLVGAGLTAVNPLIGTAVSTLGTLISNGQQKKEQEKQEKALLNQAYAEKKIEDAEILANFNSSGVYTDMYANGGSLTDPKKAKVLKVKDKNHPRYKAYQDSLTLFNISNKQRLKGNDNSRTFYPYNLDSEQEELKKAIKNKEEKSYGYEKVPNTGVYRVIQRARDTNIKDDDRLYPNSFTSQTNNDEVIHPRIKPIDSYDWGHTKSKGDNGNTNFIYKKPEQPVVIEKPKVVNKVGNKVVNKGGSSKPLARVTKGNKNSITVNSKNDPRYKAYQDSLTLYNESNKDLATLKKMESSGKAIDFLESRYKPTEPRKNNKYPLTDKAEIAFNSLKKLNKKEPKGTNTKVEYSGLFGLNSSITTPVYAKPKQAVVVNTNKPIVKPEKTTTGKQVKEEGRKGMVYNESFTKKAIPDLPRVNAVDLPPIQMSKPNINVPQELVASNIPKSYNIKYDAPNLRGGQMPIESEYLDNRNVNQEELQTVIKSKNQYNNYIEEKYGNEEALKNPKAVNRLAKLKQSVSVTPVYADGGGLPQSSIKGKYATIGGKSKTIGNGVEEIEGNTHEESEIDGTSGVKLLDPATGEPQAEVEDEEVIVDGDYVFSDRLTVDGKTTFAKKMKSITFKRNKVEERLEKTNDTKDRAGYERALAGFDMAEEVLKMKQEEAKVLEGEQGLNTLAAGGFITDPQNPKYVPTRKRKDVLGNDDEYTNSGKALTNPNYYNPIDYSAFIDPAGQGAERTGKTDMSKLVNEDQKEVTRDTTLMDSLAPSLLDNVVNLGLTMDSPKLAKPILKRAASMKTTFNASPQIGAIKNAVAASKDNILGNTSNSNVARANIAAVRLSGAKQLGEVYANKENIETQLTNADKMNRQGVSNTNTDILNDQNMLEFTRSNDIQSRLSGNAADLGKDVNKALERKDMDTYYDEAMFLSLLDDPTGDKMRVMERNPYFAKYMKKGMFKAGVAKEKQRKNTK